MLFVHDDSIQKRLDLLCQNRAEFVSHKVNYTPLAENSQSSLDFVAKSDIFKSFSGLYSYSCPLAKAAEAFSPALCGGYFLYNNQNSIILKIRNRFF